MEQFVLGIFQEQLSKFIVGFRKEQVNANLLNGKGEITNVEINCAALNAHLSKVTPFVELERVHVSRLSFSVTSWANLRKAPIVIDVEDVRAHILEPLHYLDKSQRRDIQQILHSQLAALLQKGIVKKRGAYNLFDRILDNLTIEIRSIFIEFTTWGKFKTRRPGPWTPPRLRVRLAGVRMVSVDEYGQEGSPDDVWRHNHNRHAFLIYKKIVIPDYQVSIVPNSAADGEDSDGGAIPIISGRDSRMELQLAIKRRVRDGETLAVQLDATVPAIEIDVQARMLPHLHSLVQALVFLLAKDRPFVDPLRPRNGPVDAGAPDEQNTQRPEVFFSREESAVNESTPPGSVVDVDENDSSSSSDGEDVIDTKGTASSRPADSIRDASSASSRPATPPLSSAALGDGMKDRPIIVLPLGLCIHERLSFSLSVHHLTVRGTYAASSNSSDGYIQLDSKGFIAEMIWPKVDKTKGGYVQTSCGFIRVTERFSTRIRTLLVGGAESSTGHHNYTLSQLEIARDESFPLYEDRSIRPDPCGLRHTFPVQSFGLKTTVEFVERTPIENREVDGEDIKVVHEFGIDKFDVVADCQSWARVLLFLVNEPGQGFDPRVTSGDWSNVMIRDMLLQPNGPLDLESCLQPVKELMLDENDFLSSDLFNVTARVTNLALRVPAAISDDIRSCDIVTNFTELTIVVSSALPRTCLSGRIGSSIYGDDAINRGVIDFPNDPADVSYVLECSEDPSNRQRGEQITRSISTFRIQVTCRRSCLRLVPIIACTEVEKSKELFSQDELTMIICFEGEPPNNNNRNLSKIALFSSFEAHQLVLCLDFELLSSAVGTVVYFARGMTDAFNVYKRLRDKGAVPINDSREEFESLIPATPTSSRRVLVRRQLHRSHESGGISFAFCFKVMELDVSLWRRNIQNSYQIKAHQALNLSDTLQVQDAQSFKILSIEMNEAEIGLEGVFRLNERRLIAKAAISEIIMQTYYQQEHLVAPVQQNPSHGLFCKPSSNLLLLKVGHRDRETSNESNNGLSFRAEERTEKSRVWALGWDIGNVTVNCEIEAIEFLVLIIFETLLMPAWSRYDLIPKRFDAGSWKFPEGSIGALIQGLLSVISNGNRLLSFSTAPDTADTSDDFHHTVPATIDAFLRDIIWKLVPADVELILLRYTGQNILIKLPSHSDDLPPYGLVLEKTELKVSYMASRELEDKSLMNVLGAPGSTWHSIIQSVNHGLRHTMQCRQQIISCFADRCAEDANVALVEPFDVAYSYITSNVVMEVGNQIIVRETERLDDFLTCLHSFGLRCIELKRNIHALVKAYWRAAEPVNSRSVSGPKPVPKENPTSMACLAVAASIRLAREYTRIANIEWRTFAKAMKHRLQEREDCIVRMRYMVFEKERSRLATLALVSSNVTGWLRIGSYQRIGQRGIMSWNLQPRWCVLQKLLLFVYPGPGQFTPVDIISLAGSSLQQLAGGRKRDLKRAFALVESSGAVHLILTATDHEFYRWIQTLAKCTGQSNSRHGAPKEAEVRTENETLLPGYGQMVLPTAHGDGIGRSESFNPLDGNIDQASLDTETVRGDSFASQQLRDRFAGMRNATKNRVGLAIVAAKQKGRDVSMSVRARRTGATSQSQKRSLPPLATSNRVEPIETSWVCLTCTFQNQSMSLSCSMCQAIRKAQQNDAMKPVDAKSTFSDIDNAYQQLNDDADDRSHDGEIPDLQSIRGMKSRIGAAMMSIRRINPDDSIDEDASSRYKIHTSDEPTIHGAPPALRLRDVCLAGPLPPIRYVDPIHGSLFSSLDEELKRLDGVWAVSVCLDPDQDTDSHHIHQVEPNDHACSSLTTDDVNEDSEQNLSSLKTPSQESSSTEQCSTGDQRVFSPDEILKLSVTIRIFNQDILTDPDPQPQRLLKKQVYELLALHSLISECISTFLSEIDESGSLPEADPQSVSLDSSCIDNILLMGRLLAGLIDHTPARGAKPLHAYCADLCAKILNTMLECYLPMDALVALVDFLGITDASTKGYNLKPSHNLNMTIRFDDADPEDIPCNAISVINSADMCLLQAESQALTAENIATTEANSRELSRKQGPTENVRDLYHPISHSFREAMYASLMNVMEERDEAHARMVAADVVHVHEIEQERKIIKHLSNQLEKKDEELEILRLSVKNSKGNFKTSSDEAVIKVPSNVFESDTEIVSLCRQMSAEISSRTSASLEIIRLKECRRIERQNEAAERQALEDELRRTRALLAKQREELEQCQYECLNWKQSYEKILNR